MARCVASTRVSALARLVITAKIVMLGLAVATILSTACTTSAPPATGDRSAEAESGSRSSHLHG